MEDLQGSRRRDRRWPCKYRHKRPAIRGNLGYHREACLQGVRACYHDRQCQGAKMVALQEKTSSVREFTTHARGPSPGHKEGTVSSNGVGAGHRS